MSTANNIDDDNMVIGDDPSESSIMRALRREVETARMGSSPVSLVSEQDAPMTTSLQMEIDLLRGRTPSPSYMAAESRERGDDMEEESRRVPSPTLVPANASPTLQAMDTTPMLDPLVDPSLRQKFLRLSREALSIPEFLLDFDYFQLYRSLELEDLVQLFHRACK